MIPAKPFKWVCPKCGYSKVVIPESDVIDPRDYMNRCPKCNTEMEKKPLNLFDNIKQVFS